MQNQKVLVVVDANGDEHEFTEDDNFCYWSRYGRDEEDQSTNDHELRIYRNCGIDRNGKPINGSGAPVVVAVFFHPRYMKIFWDA